MTDVDDARIAAQWKQVALEIGNDVFQRVNTSETVGTDDETGYLLMFFNQKDHGGYSTMLSTANRAATKKLLKTVIRELDGPKSTIVEPDKWEN